MKKVTKGTPVAVYWDDAGDHVPEWQDASEVEPALHLTMVSYGIYLGVKKKAVLLAATHCPGDDTVTSTSQVPVGCVRKIVKLKE